MEEIKNLLNRASFEERKALADILDASQPTSESIIDAFWRKSQSLFTYIFGNEPSYKTIVQQGASQFLSR